MEWIIKNNDTTLPLLQRILDQREIEDIDKFLNPKFSDIHDAFLLNDIEAAIETIKKAVNDKKKIFIHGDFDVDGVTATSIMWLFLTEAMNADVLPYIPSRFDEGYGLSQESVEAIIEAGGQLIISVDCGIKDLKIVDKYKDQIDFIITDHHTLLKENEYSDEKRVQNGFAISKHAKAVVHPALNKKYPFRDICGALVSWKVCYAINEKLKLGFNTDSLLGLAALGTVCDVMPLIDENRAVVKLGIEQIRRTENVGLKALCEVSGININEIDTYHFGFVIGPRINAAGRLEHALDAVRLFCTKNPNAARVLAEKLNTLNQKRQQITKDLIEIAEEQIEDQKENKIYFAYAEDWPEGIVGLVAGRLCGKYNRPVLIGSKKDNIVKGSARSIEGFNIADTLKTADQFLERHGGHAQAAGFQLNYSTLPEFLEFLQDYANAQIADKDMIPKLFIDTFLNEDDLFLETLDSLNALAPFGNKNEEPIFVLNNTKIIDKKLLGNNGQHVKFVLELGGAQIESISFNNADAYKLIQVSDTVNVAGKLNKNSWNGVDSLQLKIEDIVKVS